MNNLIYLAHYLLGYPKQSYWYLLVFASKIVSVRVFDLEQSNNI